jgi:hypothetical protein
MTLCPIDLVERAEKLGVFGEMAGHLKVPAENLRAEAERYVTHFVVGGGVGQQGNRWMMRLRGQLTKKAQAKELAAPVETAPEAKSGARQAADPRQQAHVRWLAAKAEEEAMKASAQ